MNFGRYPDGQRPDAAARRASSVEPAPRRRAARKRSARPSTPRAADELGLVTVTPDDIDWEDEVRTGARGARRASRPTR